MKHSPIERIFLRLDAGQLNAGWASFLETYGPMLRRIVRQFASDPAAADDCYEHVCAQLSDDGFRRLRTYNLDSPARFETWLTTVAANSCRDWLRRIHGRRRPPRFIRERPEQERLIFEYMYRRGMTHHECLHVLKDRHPNLTADEIGRISAGIYRSLSPHQRWQLSIERDKPVSIDDTEPMGDVAAVPIEESVQFEQEMALLQQALSSMDADQRLLIQLRYQEGLTLREIARLLGYEDPFRARRAIEKALRALRGLIEL